MTTPKFTRRRQRLFMTGTSGLRHLSRTKKYGFSTPNSGSSLASSAPDGMARARLSQYLHMVQLKLRDPKDGNIFMVNGRRLKPCIQNPEPGTDVESVKLTDPTDSF
jgi:hypothetical protein